MESPEQACPACCGCLWSPPHASLRPGPRTTADVLPWEGGRRHSSPRALGPRQEIEVSQTDTLCEGPWSCDAAGQKLRNTGIKCFLCKCCLSAPSTHRVHPDVASRPVETWWLRLGTWCADSCRGGTSWRNHVLQKPSEWPELFSSLFLSRRKRKMKGRRKTLKKTCPVLPQP